MNHVKSVIVSVLSVAFLSACVPQSLIDKTKGNIAESSASNIKQLESFSAQIANSKAFYEKSQEVDKPFLAGKPVPLAREVNLPQALKKGVKTVFMFPDKKNSLTEVAQRILMSTGIAVTISPDVYLPNSDLLPKKKTSEANANVQTTVPVAAAAGRTSITASTPLPIPFGDSSYAAKFNTSGRGSADIEVGPMFEFPVTEAPLSQILDMVAARLGIQWQYDDVGNTIKFYRLVTKTWQLPVGSHKNDFSTKIEGGTSDSTNSNALTQKTTNAPINSSYEGLDELKSITDSVDTVMTKAGSISSSLATGTITLTDTKDSIEAADRLIKTHIKILSRLVMMRVRTVQVTSTDNGESGVNWDALLTKALNNIPGFSLMSSSPASLVDSGAGTIGLNILSGSGNGTQAIISALREIGDVDATTELPLSSRNRHAVYYNVRNTFSYVSQTTPATATAGGTGGTPGITTSQNQVGTKIVLYPNATSKDNVMLTVAFDQSVLKDLKNFTSGTGTAQQTVQLPNVDGQGSSQEIPVRDGQTIVLTGFDRRTNEYDKRTLGEYSPMIFGGSHKALTQRTTTLVLVSVVVRDIDN